MSLFDRFGAPRSRLAPVLALPFLFAMATGCSSAAGDAEGLGSGDGGTSGADGGAGYTGAAGDDGAGGTTGADPSGGDSGGAADDGLPPPEDEPPMEEPPPDVCNDVDEVVLFLSPDDSNSMSSPVQVREAALDGFSSINVVPIRTWEFLNYYGFDYPAAPGGEVLVTPSLAAGEADGEYTLQIAVTSEAVAVADRRPMNVTLVLDTSGSMAGHSMDMLRASALAIAGSLKEGDSISMVTWSTSNATILGGYQVTGPSDPLVVDEINALEAGGGTDLNGGLTAGYELANQVFDANRINRIVLISDGGANAGVTDIELIAQNAGGNDADGIYMVGVGVGSAGTYNDELMDTVTDAGKGASVFVNDAAEAAKIFGDDFISTMDVAVRDVQVQLDMPPGFEVVKFSGEEISTDPSEVEPQHLAPNDSMVFHQTIATCAPELGGPDAEFTVTVRYLDGVTFEQRETALTQTFGSLLDGDNTQLLKGAAIFEYAEGLKAYQQSADSADLEPAFAALDAADLALPGDEDLAEIRSVLQAL